MGTNLCKKNKGMTLIEVLLAIAIIGIIVVTFIPIITSGFMNVVSSGNRTQSMYHSSGKIEEVIGKRESIDLEGELLIFQSAHIPIKFNNTPVKYVTGGKIVKNEIAAFITDVPTLKFEPYFLYEGYLDEDKKITVTSTDIKFLNTSRYKINDKSFSPTRNNDNKIELTLPLGSTAWKNEYNPYKFEVETGIKSAKGLIQILQPKAMIVGSIDTIKISSDLINGFATWQDRSFNNNGLNSVKYIDSMIGKGYIAVGKKGKIVNLYDGFGWDHVTISTFDKELMDITYGNRNLIAVGKEGSILHSNSKDIWNIIDPFTNKDLIGVGFGLLDKTEYFVMVGENGTWLRWDIEETWEEIDWGTIDSIIKEEIESQTLNDIQAINYKKENGKSMTMFVAVGTNGSIVRNSVLVSGAEGKSENWLYSKFTTSNLNAISFNKKENNPIIVAVGENGTILYSDNENDDLGQNWEAIQVSSDISFSDVQFFEEKFFAIGNKSNGDAFLIISVDGKNWIPTTTNLGKMVINGVSGY